MAIDPQLLTGLGCAASMFFCAIGSAYASSHSGVYAVRGTDYKAFAPIIISGVLALYGIIISILLAGKFDENMTQAQGYRNLSAGLAVGFTCMASGLGIAIFMKELNQRHTPTALPRPYSENEEPLVGQRATLTRAAPVSFVYLCLCLCFLEAIGLYGLIVALFLIGS
jgi:V-type H+-transporting ATPase 16kDa proteolipid subunit